uniref:Sieve element occlusion N-terminal domain-containing protein n=1 Tax=Fagus sylvatica TaxID=28930 RepID=A0A2N9GZT6_FAGSY
MASRKASASSYQPNKSFFTLSDQEILTKIYATHVCDNEKLDVESLLIIAENILNRATLAFDNALLGTQETIEQWEEKTPKASFSPPLCTLKLISYEMNCKAGPSDENHEIAQETTLSILEKLSSYSWDAKAVLTLASFALEYGEFYVLAQIQPSDQLVNSVRNLKRAPALLKHATLQKHQQAFVDLNKVIRATLEVIKCIFELEKLSNYDTKVLNHIEVDVYWAIITIVASTTQLSCIFSDEDKKQELNHYAVKLNVHPPQTQEPDSNLQRTKRWTTIMMKYFGLMPEETEAYRKLVKLFQTSMEITEVLTGLIDPTNKMQPLNDWSTKELLHVEIDVLKTKNVLLFISDLDISDADISILRLISDKIGKEDHYKIVWIPFMEEWTKDQKDKFENSQSNMLWYTGYIARYNLKKASCRFIKEQWHFKGKPLLVVLNSQGQVECENAMHMIRVYGVESFPFTRGAEETLLKEKCWIEFVIIHIKKEIPRWIKEKKYIFLYGGKEKWIQKFTEKATLVQNDILLKEKGISIELVAVEKEKLNVFESFWTSIESMFISKAQWKTETDDVGQEIQKLFSYKNESAWTVFTKGSSVLVSVSGKTVLKALEDFDTWKENLHENGL